MKKIIRTIVIVLITLCGVQFIEAQEETLNAEGCYFGSNTLPTHNLTNTSGDLNFDQINITEYNLLTQVFGVYPAFYYLYDTGSPNAYATPYNVQGIISDGTIMLGFNLIQSECGNSPSGTCSSIPIILAHEFGHILDFKYGIGLEWKYKELFADYIAGAYLYHRANTIGSLNIEEVAYSFFSKGGYDFNNPLHHGTPQERYVSLNAGYILAQQYSTYGQYLSIPDLINSAMQFVSQL